MKKSCIRWYFRKKCYRKLYCNNYDILVNYWLKNREFFFITPLWLKIREEKTFIRSFSPTMYIFSSNQRSLRKNVIKLVHSPDLYSWFYFTPIERFWANLTGVKRQNRSKERRRWIKLQARRTGSTYLCSSRVIDSISKLVLCEHDIICF